MANKYFQSIIYQMNDLFGRHVGIIDDAGIVFSYGDHSAIEEKVEDILSLIPTADKVLRYGGYTFYSQSSRLFPEFVVFVQGEDEEAEKCANVLYISLSGIKQLHDEKYDKANLIKNIVLDNVLPGDVLVRAKELHIPYDTPRAVMFIKMSEMSDGSGIDILMNLFPERNRDFIIGLDEKNIILVKELDSDAPEDVEKIGQTVVDTLNSESLTSASVGIGSIAPTIQEIAKSYKEAQVALEVGKVFDTEKNIINYENLGIGRLIYQLPTTLCELFLDEIFKKESIDILDRETIHTIQEFFANNLNVSETSRQLYVHRNTLVYRLDKVQKLTGLDLRVFDEAVVFKVAMMVKKYLVSNPIKL
ncbi:MAG: helix-turn-helix domain-containing protein [Clostridia bacterium]|nr:helix-turn-helix domain-containing protein [Clostridia bacterium]